MIRLVLLVSMLLGSLATVPVKAAQQDDIRIVIDVSGSMVHTDPYNLRVPAVRMLNGLLPTGSMAGIWTFGRYVNMEVKWGRVDNKWRTAADTGASNIHSRAQFTNIENALKRAAHGWAKADKKTRRNLILLTDGKVDISKDPEKNQQSRQRLLQDILPALVENGIKVHAIALSKHSDEELLKRLAVETTGSFEIAQTAKDLQRIFLRMFERAAKPDSVPLKGNRFNIDKSISEMTLLVFRKTPKPVQLIQPDRELLRKSKHGSNVRWRSDEGYDLITVSKPLAGEWQLDADIDEDNRVMIVTDLKLVVDELPAYASPDQELQLRVELHDKNKKIGKRSFLKFVKFNLLHSVNGEETSIPLNLKKSREIKDKGVYLHQFDRPLAEGAHEFVVSADARTFTRSKRVNIEVQWPVSVETEKTDQPGEYRLIVRAREEFLKAETLRLEVKIKSPDGQVSPLAMAIDEQQWIGDINATEQTGLYAIEVKITGQNQSDKQVSFHKDDISVLGMKIVRQEEVPVTEPVSVAEEHPSDESSHDEESSSLTWSIIMIAVFNVALLAIGGGIYFYLRRKRQKDEFDLMDDIEEEVNND